MFDERETDNFELTADLSAFQRRLASLSPAAPRVDRDRLMFDAGRAAERAGREDRAIRLADPSWAGRDKCATGSASGRFWPAATAVMTAASLILAVTLVVQNQSGPAAPNAVPRTTIVGSQIETVAPEFVPARRRPVASTSYLATRDAALADGMYELVLDANGDSHPSLPPTTPVNSRQLLDQLLPGTTRERG